MEHRIRYNIAFPLIGLCASLFILAVSAKIGASLNTITGVIVLVVSVLQLLVPVVVVTADEIHLRNLFGMTLRRVSYTLDILTFDGNRPLVGGARVRGFSSWALDGAAVKRFRDDVVRRKQG